MSAKSPSLRRIQADIRELAYEPSDRYYAAPLENDMFEWHFTIKGADGTDFQGGIYHGRILLPPDYPFKPPHIVFLTPSGRFEINTKVCLSFSAYHPELWQPAWGIRLILEALISFLPTPADGAVGAIDWSSTERKKLALKSQNFICPLCGPTNKLIPTSILSKSTTTCQVASSPSTTAKSKSSTIFQRQIEELQRLQFLNHAVTEENKPKTTTEDDAITTTKESSGKVDADDTVASVESSLQANPDGNSQDTVEITTTTKTSENINTAPELQNENTSKLEQSTSAKNTSEKDQEEQQKLQKPYIACTKISDSPNTGTTTDTTATIANVVTAEEEVPIPVGPVVVTDTVPAPVPATAPAPAAIAAPVDANAATMLISNVLDPILQGLIVTLSIICYMLFRQVQKLVTDLQQLEKIYNES